MPMTKHNEDRWLLVKKIKNIFKNQSKRTNYLLILLLSGLLLIIVGKAFSPPPKETPTQFDINEVTEESEVTEAMSKQNNPEATVQDLEANYEKELKELLNKIKGVSETEVMVNLDSTNVKIYEKNLIIGQQTTDEADKNGGLRKVEDSTEETQVVLVRQGDKDVPLLVQTKKPMVRGVFVVAKGVDHATVKMWVIEAVARVLDVPPHKVSVMPKE